MKKRILAILVIMCMVMCAFPFGALAADTEREYKFDLSVDGEYEVKANTGDIITVTLLLEREDSSEAADMYAMQAEMLYDDEFLQLVENSTMTYAGVNSEDMARRTGGRAFYLNFLSLDGGAPWEASTVVGSYQMKVTGKQGTSTIHTENCIVSTADGKDRFISDSTDVKVIVSTDCIVKFEENGGSEIEDITAIYGEKIERPEDPIREGYVLKGWYKDLDCTEEWNFEEDTVKGNMTLYASWITEEEAAILAGAEGGGDKGDTFPWWIIIIIIAAIIIAILLMGKKRVAFDTDGGMEIDAVYVKKGEKLQRPLTPTKAGAMFAGWYKDDKRTIPWNFEEDRVNKSMTLFAKWM